MWKENPGRVPLQNTYTPVIPKQPGLHINKKLWLKSRWNKQIPFQGTAVLWPKKKNPGGIKSEGMEWRRKEPSPLRSNYHTRYGPPVLMHIFRHGTSWHPKLTGQKGELQSMQISEHRKLKLFPRGRQHSDMLFPYHWSLHTPLLWAAWYKLRIHTYKANADLIKPRGSQHHSFHTC